MIQILEKQNHHFEAARHHSVGIKNGFMPKGCGYDNVSTYSEVRPFCANRPKGRRSSIKEVFSNTMLSVLSRSQSEQLEAKSHSKEKVAHSKSNLSVYSRRTSPWRPPRSKMVRDFRRPSVTDLVTLPDHSGDGFITDCLQKSCKPGMRKDFPGANLQQRTISVPAIMDSARTTRTTIQKFQSV